MSTYTTSENRITEILNKYKKHLQVGDYLLIKELLTKMRKIKNGIGIELEKCSGALETQSNNTDFWRDKDKQIREMTFAERLKFLFRK